MPGSPREEKLKNLRRTLRFRASETEINPELLNLLSRWNTQRINRIARQIGPEKQRAIEKLQRDETLTKRDQALLNNSELISICKAEYNKEIRQYSFVFAALNIMEDAIRCAINETYYSTHRSLEWHKDLSMWPAWFYNEAAKNQDKIARMTSCDTSEFFLEDLNFGALLSFISDENAWGNSGTNLMFLNKRGRSGALLPNLSRLEVEERLGIIQMRRNKIFHHKVLKKEYVYITREETPRRIKYTDGTPKNTIDRVAEILDYLGMDLEEIMSGVGGGRYSFYASDPADRE